MPSLIQEKVCAYLLVNTFLPADNLPELRFREDLGMESSDLHGVLRQLEMAFHIRIPDAELSCLRRVQDLISCLEKCVPAHRPPPIDLVFFRLGAP